MASDLTREKRNRMRKTKIILFHKVRGESFYGKLNGRKKPIEGGDGRGREEELRGTSEERRKLGD